MKVDNDFDALHSEAFIETGFWGRKGAGCVVFALSTGKLLLAHRSDLVLEPNTWGTWGGAIDPKEDPKKAALRELSEETGIGAADHNRVIESYVFNSPDGGFRYHNFIVVVDEEFEPDLNWESQGSDWVAPDDLPADLHPGLAAFMSSDIAQQQLSALVAESNGLNGVAKGGEEVDQPLSAVERFKMTLLAIDEELKQEQPRPSSLPRLGR
nr:NUDIX hydrolase [Pseudomonas chengduensis]